MLTGSSKKKYMRSFIILLLLIITLLVSSLFELTTVSDAIFWLITGAIAIYIGLVLFNPLLLIKVTGTQTTVMTYVNSFTYCLLIAYYFFVSDHRLSVYLACYLIFAYFVMFCVKYYKRNNKDEV